MMERRSFNHGIIEHTSEYVHIEFPNSQRVLSSAPYNGGMIDSDHLLILKVRDNFDGTKGPFEPLAVTFKNYCSQRKWSGICVGMMTSAQMTSFRKVRRSARGVEISVLVTAGISNARRAGDLSEYRAFDEIGIKPGTINIIILTNAILTEAAQVEAVMGITEAKTAVLQDLSVTSPISGKTATGTGTDAVAIVSGSASPEIRYCGKHTLFGEILASAVMDALSSSLENVS